MTEGVRGQQEGVPVNKNPWAPLLGPRLAEPQPQNTGLEVVRTMGL